MVGTARFAIGAALFLSLGACSSAEPTEEEASEIGTTTQALSTMLSDTGSGYSGYQSWAEGSTHGPWVDRFNGLGGAGAQNINGAYGESLWLKPKQSTSAGETHSALVTSSASFGTMTYTASVQLAQQLRTGSAPNAWEAPWVVWDSANVGGYNRFYYLALKPTGWEFGKADADSRNALHQTFFKTGSSPTGAVNTWHTVKVQQTSTGATTITVDGTTLVSNFVDPGSYIARYTGGNVGLYTEDAYIMADNITVTNP